MKQFSPKSFVLGVVASALLFTGATALAAGQRSITATLDEDISIIFRGEKATLKDANGKTVYPVIYSETTYVPLRGVSQLFGESVGWDGDTRSAIIGSAETAPTSGTVYIVGDPTPFTFDPCSFKTIGITSSSAVYTTNLESVVVTKAVLSDKSEPILTLEVTGSLSDIQKPLEYHVGFTLIGRDAYGKEVPFGTKTDSLDTDKTGATVSGTVTMTFPKSVVKVELDRSSSQDYAL
jgi:hypothetical protein